MVIPTVPLGSILPPNIPLTLYTLPPPSPVHFDALLFLLILISLIDNLHHNFYPSLYY